MVEYKTRIGVFGGEINLVTKDLDIYFNGKYLFTVYIKKDGINPMDADAVGNAIEAAMSSRTMAKAEPTVSDLRQEIVSLLSQVQTLKPETRKRLASLTSQVNNVLLSVE